jgi:GNAT superfamily N-acetyltransferase
MDIRKARITEGYQIEALVKMCAEESGMMMIDAVDAHGAISKTVLSPNCHVYVALLMMRWSGSFLDYKATCSATYTTWRCQCVLIRKWSRMGIGSMLMEYFLLEHGWRNVYAEVVSDNEPIIKLLTKCNFKLVCSLPKFVNTRRGFRDKMILTYNG